MTTRNQRIAAIEFRAPYCPKCRGESRLCRNYGIPNGEWWCFPPEGCGHRWEDAESMRAREIARKAKGIG